jgi:cytochrome c-type biogenesis protein CcmE
MSANRKLVLAALGIVGVTIYMAYLGGSASWQYYVTADECAVRADELLGSRVRVSGKVAPNTLRIDADRRQATFSIQGSYADLAVTCPGPLPDNLAEGIEVVVEGRLETPLCASVAGGRIGNPSYVVKGQKVITRCASKYQSQASRPATETAARTLPRG